MKSGSFLGVFIIVLGLWLSSCGQQTSSSTALDDRPAASADLGDLGEGAILKFDTLQHDFGVIPGGEEVACRFGFTNTGSAPLLISDVKAGCGCTNVMYPKQPVQPGDRGAVEVTFNTRGRNGNQRKNVVVISNGVEQSILLSFTAQIN